MARLSAKSNLKVLPYPLFLFVYIIGVFLFGCSGTAVVDELTQKSSQTTQAEVSDPIKLSSGSLCDDAQSVLKTLNQQERASVISWGKGQEFVISRPVGPTQGEFHLFLNDHGILVGIVTVIPDGLELGSYPGIRQWLTRTKKAGFIVESNVNASSEGIRSASYHLERTRKHLHGVVALSRTRELVLYVDSRVLPGFVGILAANSERFLQLITDVRSARETSGMEQDDFLSLQHFAGAEIDRVGLCGDPNLSRAVEGYRNALDIGFLNTVYEAEAYHRIGLSYRDQKNFPNAIEAMEKSLDLRPAIAEVHNHLGTVYQRMHNSEQAITEYSIAVRLKPNYLAARFHLAQAYVEVDRKRSIREFETYIALAEDVKGEQNRLQQAKEHLAKLKAK